MLHTVTTQTQPGGCHSLTAQVQQLVAQSGVQNGFCTVALPHTTAGLCITSFWDPRGLDDLMDEIARSFPARVNYKHQDSPYDAAGHVKSAFIGSSAMLLIQNGKLILGSSQGLVLLEFDGPRTRNCHVQITEKEVQISRHNLQTEYMGMHDITGEIQQAVTQSGITSGLCHVSMLHSTAGLLLCANSPHAMADIMGDMERLVPTRVDFKHRETASDAGGHVKTAFSGSQYSFPVVDGKLRLGAEQAIVFSEFDGPRPRSFFVGVIPQT